jgi:hypothetical protein
MPTIRLYFPATTPVEGIRALVRELGLNPGRMSYGHSDDVKTEVVVKYKWNELNQGRLYDARQAERIIGSEFL